LAQHLADLETCAACHPDAFAQQQSSAHSFASFNNPVYRVAVEAFRNEVGRQASNLCAGCHDPALLLAGRMAQSISPSDPLATVGISCRLCHGVAIASSEGNGSYQLRATPLPLPRDGDPQSLLEHKRAARPLHAEALCGSCHESFLSPSVGNQDVLRGQNELLSWRDSAYSGQGASRVDQVDPRTCVQCHMADEDAPLGDVAATGGTISSHRFLGAHTWLAAMRGDSKSVARTKAFLRGVASVDVLSRVEDDKLILDVVVRNTNVGHHFPGGVRDASQTWIEVRVLDERREVLLHSKESDAHRLQALVANQEGAVLSARETHEFAGTVIDHTIAPRDAAIVRFVGSLSEEHEPTQIDVSLFHQSRTDELAALACQESKSRVGREYQRLGDRTLDACMPQPRTRIAEVRRAVGDWGEDDYRRSYEHGIGLLHSVQERLEEARPSLMRALQLAHNNIERAQALVALGQLEGKQGRVKEALVWLAMAAPLAPESAAVPASRGDALARVWRWQQAADAYEEAVSLADRNASLWRRYANALGSANRMSESLHAAQQGLQLAPRNADLLRTQALALKALKSPLAEEAMDVYLKHRGPDNLSSMRLACIQASERCAQEAVPIHAHQLTSK
jgi:tetratricopeptide (TPR) repeat protein